MYKQNPTSQNTELVGFYGISLRLWKIKMLLLWTWHHYHLKDCLQILKKAQT